VSPEDANGPPFLLDTHIWLWYLIGASRLPSGLRAAIDGSSSRVWLSPISVWEVGMLEARGRLRLVGGFRAWTDEADRRFPVEEAGLSREVAIVSHEIELPHRDPADRLLAATALVYRLTLITVDERLSSAPWLPTRSE